MFRVLYFRQIHQSTILLTHPEITKCITQTDEKNHVNLHIKEMMHNNTSGQKQLTKNVNRQQSPY